MKNKLKFILPLALFGLMVTSCSAASKNLPNEYSDEDMVIPTEWTDYSVPATSISFAEGEETLHLIKGDTHTYNFTIQPVKATAKSVNWLSGDERVVTIENGVLKAVGGGATKVTVSSPEKAFDDVQLTVYVKVPVKGISVDKEVLDLDYNQDERVNVTFDPIDATDKTLTWSIDDTSIAAVDNGVITSKAVTGSTIAHVYPNALGETATVDIRVDVRDKTIHVEKILLDELNEATNSMSLEVTKNSTLHGHVYPENATHQELAWSSSNESVAIVDQAGNISTLDDGDTNIIISAENGVTRTVALHVYDNVPDSIDVTQSVIQLDTDKVTTAKVAYVYKDSSGAPMTPSRGQLTFTSSNTGVATVDNKGNVQAVTKGSSTITVEDTFYGVSTTVDVDVITFASKVELSDTTRVLGFSENFTLTATVTPTEHSEGPVVFSVTSGNSLIDLVDNGNGTASVTSKTATGTATIMAKVGSVSASCIVKIIRTGYYVVGNFNNWTLDINYLLKSTSDSNHYVIEGRNLQANDILKVLHSDGTWFGNDNYDWDDRFTVENGNIKVLTGGTYTINFYVDAGGTNNHVVIDSAVALHLGHAGEWDDLYFSKRGEDEYYLGNVTLAADDLFKLNVGGDWRGYDQLKPSSPAKSAFVSDGTDDDNFKVLTAGVYDIYVKTSPETGDDNPDKGKSIYIKYHDHYYVKLGSGSNIELENITPSAEEIETNIREKYEVTTNVTAEQAIKFYQNESLMESGYGPNPDNTAESKFNNYLGNHIETYRIQANHTDAKVQLFLYNDGGYSFWIDGGTSGDHKDEENKTVYFTVNNGWENVYVYAFGSGGVEAPFPGTAATKIGMDNEAEHPVFMYTVDLADYDTVIFSNGLSDDALRQTDDVPLTLSGDNGFYCGEMSGEKTYYYGSFAYQAMAVDSAATVKEGKTVGVQVTCPHGAVTVTPSNANATATYNVNTGKVMITGVTAGSCTVTVNDGVSTAKNIAVTITANPTNNQTVYFSNNRGWTNVYAYVFEDASNAEKVAWPGEAMTFVTVNKESENVYKYTVDLAQYDNIIFNNGESDENKCQTADISLDDFVAYTGYYCNSEESPYAVGTYTYGLEVNKNLVEKTAGQSDTIQCFTWVGDLSVSSDSTSVATASVNGTTGVVTINAEGLGTTTVHIYDKIGTDTIRTVSITVKVGQYKPAIRLYINDQDGAGWTYSGGDPYAHMFAIEFAEGSPYTSIAQMQAASVTFGGGVTYDTVKNEIDAKFTWVSGDSDRPYELILPWYIKSFKVCFYAASNDRWLAKNGEGDTYQRTVTYNNEYIMYLHGSHSWSGDKYYTDIWASENTPYTVLVVPE